MSLGAAIHLACSRSTDRHGIRIRTNRIAIAAMCDIARQVDFASVKRVPITITEQVVTGPHLTSARLADTGSLRVRTSIVADSAVGRVRLGVHTGVSAHAQLAAVLGADSLITDLTGITIISACSAIGRIALQIDADICAIGLSDQTADACLALIAGPADNCATAAIALVAQRIATPAGTTILAGIAGDITVTAITGVILSVDTQVRAIRLTRRTTDTQRTILAYCASI